MGRGEDKLISLHDFLTEKIREWEAAKEANRNMLVAEMRQRDIDSRMENIARQLLALLKHDNISNFAVDSRDQLDEQIRTLAVLCETMATSHRGAAQLAEKLLSSMLRDTLMLQAEQAKLRSEIKQLTKPRR